MERQAGRLADWALTFCEYGRFFGSHPQCEVAGLPGANASYKRELLLRHLGEIPKEFVEVIVHAKLQEAGGVLRHEPLAVMYDVNDLPLAKAASAQFHHGRLYGGDVAGQTGVAGRLLRTIRAPLVPAVHFIRIARAVSGSGRVTKLLFSLPMLFILLVAWAAGEALGSAFGPGASRDRWV